jgi:hypothetical protein
VLFDRFKLISRQPDRGPVPWRRILTARRP